MKGIKYFLVAVLMFLIGDVVYAACYLCGEGTGLAGTYHEYDTIVGANDAGCWSATVVSDGYCRHTYYVCQSNPSIMVWNRNSTAADASCPGGYREDTNIPQSSCTTGGSGSATGRCYMCSTTFELRWATSQPSGCSGG